MRPVEFLRYTSNAHIVCPASLHHRNLTIPGEADYLTSTGENAEETPGRHRNSQVFA